MPASRQLGLCKEERICSRTLIDLLFNGGKSRSLAAFPMRVVYLEQECDEAPQTQVQILVSVPKRCFKHAVDRNRVKRQVREAYRHGKHLLTDKLAETPCKSLAIAFIWLDNSLYSSEEVARRVRNLLSRLSERL